MKLFILLISFLLVQQVTNAASAGRFTKPDTSYIDTSRYAVLPFTKSRDSFLFDKDFKPASISGKEIKMIEKIIAVTVKEYNKSKGTTISKPGKYYKQLIAVTNAKGEKEVWVNCFCTDYEKRHWRKGIVMVLDGGPCFFNLKINLSTNTVMRLAVNGVA
ncbi:hypothetical protein A0256_10795 [Mucilaginibacter sp. PAMC 26640]|nr:hypothetical protein A0256_10795 [Mucilaginibacter sp. PAMC 26640]